ncbi:hypothetical protein GE061_003750 [Apolygus lucorum]|uniref:Uncharacterized protein n=1 Tax=Apolygus lucorum TaxID=248454 RepID=A0A8S9X2X6_APOLU|nr:hypothetical protein GE061_003750 [Apolygus lucorum]
MVISQCELKFKKLKKKSARRWDTGKLKMEEIALEYEETTNRRIQENISSSANIEGKWNAIKEGLLDVAEAVIGRQKAEIRKEWIQEAITRKIERRRTLKNATTEEGKREYRALRNEINRDAKQAKEEHMNEKCKEVETLITEGKNERAFRAVKEFFGGQQRFRCNGIENEEGNVVYDNRQVADRWKRYLQNLYDGDIVDSLLENDTEVDEERIGEPILREEFDSALKNLKERKAPGIDNLQTTLEMSLCDLISCDKAPISRDNELWKLRAEVDKAHAQLGKESSRGGC